MNAKLLAIGPYFVSRVFQPLVQRQSYLNILYTLLAYPLGIVYFTALVVGLTLTVGFLISVLALLATVVMVWVFSTFERHLALWLLNVDIPKAQAPIVTNQNVGAQIGAYLLNVSTWKSVVYLLVKLPIGVLSFSVVVFLIALTVSLLIAPLTLIYPEQVIHYFGWKIDTLNKALIASLLGLGIGVISIHVLNGLAFLQGQFARLMLGSSKSGKAASQ